jgi:hypothetical protein
MQNGSQEIIDYHWLFSVEAPMAGGSTSILHRRLNLLNEEFQAVAAG